MARKKKEDFDVVTASQTDDGTVVITSLNELSEERMQLRLMTLRTSSTVHI